MRALTLRADKGAPLTHAELDGNFQTLKDGITEEHTAAADALAAHANAADPHPTYLTQAEADQRYAASGITGATNLAATVSSTGVTVASDTGNDAVIPLADTTNAGAMAPAQVTKLAGLTQVSVVNDLTTGGAAAALSAEQGKSLKVSVDAAAAAAAAALPAAQKGAANGVATLDASGKLPAAQVPDIAIQQYLGSVANQAAMLALVGQSGDWCSRSDTGTVFIITGTPSVIGGWTQLSYPASAVQSVCGLVGVITVSQLGTALASLFASPAQGAKAETALQDIDGINIALAGAAPAKLATTQALVSGEMYAFRPPVFASIGDSIGAYARQAVTTTDRRFNFHGYLAWVRRFCGSRISLPIANIFNVGGKTLEEVRTEQLASAVASNADWVIAHVGTNNSNDLTNTTYAEDVADYTEIITSLNNAGKGVLFIPIRIRGAAFPISTAMRNKIAQLNVWVRNFAIGRKVLIADVNHIFLDYSSATGVGATAYLPDGTHDGPNGSILMGRFIADVILRNIVRCETVEANGLFDFRPTGAATDIQNGNQIPNPIMLGTAGTMTGGPTGVVASSYRCRVAGTLGSGTVVCSKEAVTGFISRERQVITIGGTWTAGVQVALDIDTATPVVGDAHQLQMKVSLQLISGSIAMFGAQLRMHNVSIVDTAIVWDGYSDLTWQTAVGNLTIAQDTGSLYLTTESTPLPALTTGVKPTLWIQPAAGVISCVVKIDWVVCRKVG